MVSTTKQSGGVPIVNRGAAAAIAVDTLDYDVVNIAVTDLQTDILNVTGVKPKLAHSITSSPQIIVGTLGRSKLVSELINYGLDVSKLQNQWEKFLIQVVDFPKMQGGKALVIIGSDRRGTAYGVYELSKQMGVSPWYWWGDVPVKKSKSLFAKSGSYFFGPPSVQYRGIFINDEERGLDPWARKVFDPETKQLGPKTYARIYELMLRLKANLLWPGMKRRGSFYQVDGNKEMADKYAIIIGTSHHEPLLVNSSLEWDVKRDGPWQYDVNAEALMRVMDKRVAEAAPYENVYTIGLRGHADLGMEARGGIDERIALMHTIFKDQRAILKKHIAKPIDSIPQAFTAYKEVLDLLNNGLEVPDDAILVWPDDNYGYIHQLNSDMQKKRLGGSGIYYHLNYVGRPLSSAWLSAPSPEVIRHELNKAYGNGATRLWIFNVGDIKPFEFLTSYCLDMSWKFSYNDTSLTRNYMSKWLADIFGSDRSPALAQLLSDYYQTSFERRPEFMGWERSEPNTMIINTEYSLTSYREAERRLARLSSLATKAKEIEKEMPEQLQSAYFEMFYYPIVCADLNNKKMLYAQMNRTYAQQGRAVANTYARWAKSAQDSLVLQTKKYGELEQGKWKEMMKLPWNAAYPPLATVTPSGAPAMGVDFSGNNLVRGANSWRTLPVFNKYYKESYDVVIYSKGSKAFDWSIAASDPWIKLSRTSGTCIEEERVNVFIDWGKLPKTSEAEGKLVVCGAGDTLAIAINTFDAGVPSDSLKKMFVEQNGAISVSAAHYSRKKDKALYQWVTLNDIGLTGKLMAISTDTLPRIVFEWNFAKNAPSLEYDFYTYNSGWVDIHSYTLPTHHISLQRGCLYGISIDEQPPKIIDFSTRNRNEKWQVNVMRNAAEELSRHFIEKPGKHTLKVWLIDTDVCFDKFVIDMGGLQKSYTGPVETKLW